jgi:Gluconate 2-dehydrogenase subunit 3
MDTPLNRRDLMRAMTAVAFTTLQLPAAEPNAPLFFTKDEFALLDTLTEILIPTDEHSPGAHAAGVAAYIDRTVAEAFLP